MSRKRSDLPRVCRRWIHGDSATRLKVFTPSSVPPMMKQAGSLPTGLTPSVSGLCLFLPPHSVTRHGHTYTLEMASRELTMPLTVSAQFLQDIWVPTSLRQAQDPPLPLGWSLHPSLLVEMKEQSNLRGFPATLTLIIFIESTLIISKAWRYFQVISKHFQVSWLSIKPKCVTLIVKKEGGRIRHPLLSWEKHWFENIYTV